jgi:hypothetical protein
VGLNPVPTGRKPRDFYRIHRSAICRVMGFQTKGGKPSERLPQNKTMMDGMNARMYNVPLEWIVGIEEHFPGFDRGLNWRGQPMTPIPHCTLEACYIGNLDVRLLPFKPNIEQRSRWNSEKGKTEFYRVKCHSASQRLEVRCPYCDQWVPFSRLNQHMYLRDGTRSKSCEQYKYRTLAAKKANRKAKPN